MDKEQAGLDQERESRTAFGERALNLATSFRERVSEKLVKTFTSKHLRRLIKHRRGSTGGSGDEDEDGGSDEEGTSNPRARDPYGSGSRGGNSEGATAPVPTSPPARVLLDDPTVVTLQLGATAEVLSAEMRRELWLSSTISRQAEVQAFPTLITQELKPIVDADILKDCHRTYPTFKRFSTPEGRAALRNVLRAYAAYDPDTAYCQGMNFVAGCLLMFLPSEAHAFAALVALMKDRGLAGFYGHTMPLLQEQLWLLGRLVKPELASHMEACGVVPVLYAASWLMTCYAADFPMPFAARVLDILLEGHHDHAMLKVAVSLIKEAEPDLMSCHGLEDMLEYLKVSVPGWPEDRLDSVLLDAFSTPWTRAQQSVLNCKEGQETVAQSMERIHNQGSGAWDNCVSRSTSIRGASGSLSTTMSLKESFKIQNQNQNSKTDPMARSQSVSSPRSTPQLPMQQSLQLPLLPPPPAPAQPCSLPQLPADMLYFNASNASKSGVGRNGSVTGGEVEEIWQHLTGASNNGAGSASQVRLRTSASQPRLNLLDTGGTDTGSRGALTGYPSNAGYVPPLAGADTPGADSTGCNSRGSGGTWHVVSGTATGTAVGGCATPVSMPGSRTGSVTMPSWRGLRSASAAAYPASSLGGMAAGSVVQGHGRLRRGSVDWDTACGPFVGAAAGSAAGAAVAETASHADLSLAPSANNDGSADPAATGRESVARKRSVEDVLAEEILRALTLTSPQPSGSLLVSPVAVTVGPHHHPGATGEGGPEAGSGVPAYDVDAMLGLTHAEPHGSHMHHVHGSDHRYSPGAGSEGAPVLAGDRWTQPAVTGSGYSGAQQLSRMGSAQPASMPPALILKSLSLQRPLSSCASPSHASGAGAAAKPQSPASAASNQGVTPGAPHSHTQSSGGYSFPRPPHTHTQANQHPVTHHGAASGQTGSPKTALSGVSGLSGAGSRGGSAGGYRDQRPRALILTATGLVEAGTGQPGESGSQPDVFDSGLPGCQSPLTCRSSGHSTPAGAQSPRIAPPIALSPRHMGSSRARMSPAPLHAVEESAEDAAIASVWGTSEYEGGHGPTAVAAAALAAAADGGSDAAATPPSPPPLLTSASIRERLRSSANKILPSWLQSDGDAPQSPASPAAATAAAGNPAAATTPGSNGPGSPMQGAAQHAGVASTGGAASNSGMQSPRSGKLLWSLLPKKLQPTLLSNASECGAGSAGASSVASHRSSQAQVSSPPASPILSRVPRLLSSPAGRMASASAGGAGGSGLGSMTAGTPTAAAGAAAQAGDTLARAAGALAASADSPMVASPAAAAAAGPGGVRRLPRPSRRTGSSSGSGESTTSTSSHTSQRTVSDPGSDCYRFPPVSLPHPTTPPAPQITHIGKVLQYRSHPVEPAGPDSATTHSTTAGAPGGGGVGQEGSHTQPNPLPPFKRFYRPSYTLCGVDSESGAAPPPLPTGASPSRHAAGDHAPSSPYQYHSAGASLSGYPGQSSGLHSESPRRGSVGALGSPGRTNTTPFATVPLQPIVGGGDGIMGSGEQEQGTGGDHTGHTQQQQGDPAGHTNSSHHHARHPAHHNRLLPPTTSVPTPATSLGPTDTLTHHSESGYGPLRHSKSNSDDEDEESCVPLIPGPKKPPTPLVSMSGAADVSGGPDGGPDGGREGVGGEGRLEGVLSGMCIEAEDANVRHAAALNKAALHAPASIPQAMQPNPNYARSSPSLLPSTRLLQRAPVSAGAGSISAAHFSTPPGGFSSYSFRCTMMLPERSAVTLERLRSGNRSGRLGGSGRLGSGIDPLGDHDRTSAASTDRVSRDRASNASSVTRGFDMLAAAGRLSAPGAAVGYASWAAQAAATGGAAGGDGGKLVTAVSDNDAERWYLAARRTASTHGGQ